MKLLNQRAEIIKVGSVKPENAPSSYASRFRFFRQRSGLSMEEVAQKMRERAKLMRPETGKWMNISASSISDIEADDKELFSCYSSRQTWHFAQILGVSANELLNLNSAEFTVTAAELVQRINKEYSSRGISLERFEDEVGWKLSSCMDPPELLLEDMTVDGLQWLCRELGIDWARVILSLDVRTTRQRKMKRKIGPPKRKNGDTNQLNPDPKD